jgi:epoxyqueuosine reductase
MTLKSQIEQAARQLGFSAFGVTNAEYDPIAHNKHIDWLSRGYQADMSYLERGSRQRFDPRVHLSTAQSVIVTAMNYYTKPQENPDCGYISIYARGRNYHTVLQERLKQLCVKMAELAAHDIAFKIFVDSGALAEKPLALKAGLGFIGRNSTLIIPKSKSQSGRNPLGSFHFLGVIITDLELEPDSPAIGTCGQCRKCIEACPTDAIVGDSIIDAARCISYQTTQNKGDVPDDIAVATGNIIFGCDICQVVCPYNSRVEETSEPAFMPSPDLLNPNLEALSKLTEEEFNKRFSESSIGEFRYSMFKRNIAVALKNIKNGPKLP